MPVYAMNTSVRMRLALTLQRSPTDPRPALRLTRGQVAEILASDDREWCLVRGPSGAAGWFALDGWIIRGTGREAAEYFDGLSGAD